MQDHIPNPEHSSSLVEPKAKPLVLALESAGATLFASCAGHPKPAWVQSILGSNEMAWPHFAFRCETNFAKEFSAILHNAATYDKLNYFWRIEGIHLPKFGYDIAYALRISKTPANPLPIRQRLDEDMNWISVQLRQINSEGSQESIARIQTTILRGPASSCPEKKHSEQK